MTAKRFKPQPAAATVLLPEWSAKAWAAWVDELRDVLADDERPRGRLYDLAVTAKEQAQWPARDMSDESLLGGVLRLSIAFSNAPAARREWLRDVLWTLHEVVEGMVDRGASPTVGDAKARAAAVAALPKVVEAGREVARLAAPEPGQPGYRADVHG